MTAWFLFRPPPAPVVVNEEPTGVSLAVFQALKKQVNEYNEQNDKDVEFFRDTQKKHH